MKKVTVLSAFAFALVFASCGETQPAETTGTTVTEDMVDGADGGLDSLDLPDNSQDTTNNGL